jgi:two-component system, response regulator RegA
LITEASPTMSLAGEQGRPSLLMVDDDTVFCTVMARNLATRGFDVRVAHTRTAALQLAREQPPEHAVIDLQLPDGNGLQVLRGLREIRADMKLIMLTGYSSIVTTIDAVKLGAVYYLCKPAGADDIVAAFGHRADDHEAPALAPATLPSVHRVEWEHIQRVLTQHSGCIASTARALSMHRRTLQRKLQKNPPRA